MNAKLLTVLTQQQREWLWMRYVELFPPCETEADANRRCAEKWGIEDGTVRSRLQVWRRDKDFAAAEGSLKAGITLETAGEIVEQYLAAWSLLAMQERVKLLQIPWFEVNPETGKDELLSSRLVEAKSLAIREILRMLGEWKGRGPVTKTPSEARGMVDLRG